MEGRPRGFITTYTGFSVLSEIDLESGLLFFSPTSKQLDALPPKEMDEAACVLNLDKRHVFSTVWVFTNVRRSLSYYHEEKYDKKTSAPAQLSIQWLIGLGVVLVLVTVFMSLAEDVWFQEGLSWDAPGSNEYVPFRSPDNVGISANSLMVQEDTSNAKIWRYDFTSGVWSVAATVNNPSGESSGIVDASAWFGPGAWLLDVQGHGLFVDQEQVGNVLFKRESGQLILMIIPGS
jgi:hypothetical protein